MKKIDLTGEVYGRLTVITDDGSRSNTGRVLWLCECSCGNKIHVQSQNLKNGRTKSCGCLNDEKKRERFKDLSGNDIHHYTSCGCLRGASKDYMDSIRDPESLKSTKPTAKSTTGVRGVYFNKRKGRYQAFINVDKKQKYLGSSKDFRKAVALRKNAEKEFWNL